MKVKVRVLAMTPEGLVTLTRNIEESDYLFIKEKFDSDHVSLANPLVLFDMPWAEGLKIVLMDKTF